MSYQRGKTRAGFYAEPGRNYGLVAADCAIYQSGKSLFSELQGAGQLRFDDRQAGRLWARQAPSDPAHATRVIAIRDWRHRDDSGLPVSADQQFEFYRRTDEHSVYR